MKNKLLKNFFAVLLCAILLPSASIPAFAGGEGVHEHGYFGVYSGDSEYHWMRCRYDGCPIINPREMYGFGPHVDDGKGNCSVCGYPMAMLKETASEVEAVLLNGPVVMVGEGGSNISYDGLGYFVVSYDWGNDFNGIFKQNVPYTLTVNLQATDRYVFTEGFKSVFYNNFYAYASVTLSNPKTVDWLSGYKNAQVTINFNPTGPVPCSDLKAKPAGMNRVLLTWEPYFALDGYIILRNGMQIGFTAGNQYIDTTADNAAFNYYWVIPFSKYKGVIYKGYVGGYVWAVGRTVGKPENVKGESRHLGSKAGARLTWSPAEGASSYVIYSRAGKTGPVQYRTEVAGTEFLDTGTAGQLMFYWVYGIYRDVKGNILAAGPMSNYGWAVMQ